MAYQRVREAAEKAKVELSSSAETEINLPYLSAGSDGPKHFVKKITRSQFEAMVDDLIQKTLAPCRKALKDAKLNASDVDEVLLVGGSTRIPKVQQEVEALFGKKPSKGVNPDEVVAIGAAIQGAVLAGDINDVLLLDVTPLSLGIETMGGIFTKLIEANSTIPITKSEVFSTAADNQHAVDIHVLQGERSMASDNRTLGKFQLSDLPLAPRGVPKIEVTFNIDANGIINVSAKDQGTGKVQKIVIESGSKLSDDEIKRMKDEAAENEKSDQEKLEKSKILNDADSLIFQVEKTMKDLDDKLNEDEKKGIDEELVAIKQSRKEENIEEIKKRIESLSGKMSVASTRIYSQEKDKPTEEDLENVETVDVEEETK